jgi:hypothetical protein
MIKVSVVSGLGGRFVAHSTRNDRNLIPVPTKKTIRKVMLKRSASLAKFLTF